MIFNLATFTLVHVLLSVVGIFAGLVVAGALIAGKRLDDWVNVYLVTTILTNLTGFGFPFVVLMPSHIIGVLSLLILPVVIFARYRKHLVGAWRRTYVYGIVVALYFNAFVLVVQLFRRIPALIVSAPTQKEMPFVVTQVIVLALFVWLGRAALRGFTAQAAAVAETRVPSLAVPR